MKKIKLAQGKFAIVDDEDYLVLSRFKWRIGIQNRYSKEIVSVVRRITDNGKPVDLALEYNILPYKINRIILHLNKDWLDFRKINLIYATHSLFRHSSTKAENKTSIYKGVSLSVRGSKIKPWRGMITKRDKDGKRVSYRKSFETEREAALFYNKKAKELYGEFAYQNEVGKSKRK